VARALVTSPRVLFADEPTGALDSLNGERVMELLTDAARSTNAAVVLVTHEARVAAWSDREIVVRDGKSRDMERVV
jgi:putative ABC transport system ATP-binding protein